MNEAVVVDHAVSRLRAIGGTEASELLFISRSSEPVNQYLESIINVIGPCPMLWQEHQDIQLNRGQELSVDRSKKQEFSHRRVELWLLLRREERFYLGANLRMERLTKRNLRVGHTLSFCRKLASVRESQFHSTSSAAGSTEGRYHLCTLGESPGPIKVRSSLHAPASWLGPGPGFRAAAASLRPGAI